MASDGDWRDHANCRGLDVQLFFPRRGETADRAKEICSGCVVQAECYTYSLKDLPGAEAGQKFGIWGGVSEHERRRIRRYNRSRLA